MLTFINFFLSFYRLAVYFFINIQHGMLIKYEIKILACQKCLIVVPFLVELRVTKFKIAKEKRNTLKTDIGSTTVKNWSFN